MAQTLCIKCGSETKVSSYCHLCQEPLIFACSSCEYITEEKVHSDCRNAEMLAKTATTTQDSAPANALQRPLLQQEIKKSVLLINQRKRRLKQSHLI